MLKLIKFNIKTIATTNLIDVFTFLFFVKKRNQKRLAVKTRSVKKWQTAIIHKKSEYFASSLRSDSSLPNKESLFVCFAAIDSKHLPLQLFIMNLLEYKSS